MKYALGTVLGTALIGIAKSKLGSGVRLKKGYKEVFEGKMEFPIREDSFLILQGRTDILAEIKSTVESYGAILTDINFKEVDQFDDNGDEAYHSYFMVISVKETYFKEHKMGDGLRLTRSPNLENYEQFETLLESLENDLDDIIGSYTAYDIYIHTPIWNTFSIFYIQNQSGEWEIYKSPELSKSKLRKR